LRNAIGKFTKVSISADDPFAYVGRNIYLVPTPKLDGKDTKIEDFFDDELKRVTLGGKKFNDSNKIDDAKEYGKMRFATAVVEPRADTIDFTGFRPLLENVAAAIEDYYKQVQPSVLTA
jgi:RNA-directed DNA polymerase